MQSFFYNMVVRYDTSPLYSIVRTAAMFGISTRSVCACLLSTSALDRRCPPLSLSLISPVECSDSPRGGGEGVGVSAFENRAFSTHCPNGDISGAGTAAVSFNF